MTIIAITRLEPFRVLIASTLLLSFATIYGCAKPTLQSRAPADTQPAKASDPQASNVKPGSPARIELNRRSMGTTIDTSLLSSALTDLFKRREAEKTVHIKADRALKLAEVMKVIEAVKGAGASSVRMAIEGAPEKANGSQPDEMMLVVTVGDAGFDPTKVITGGIKLYLTEFALKYSEKETVPKDFVVAEIHEGGGCVIDGKPIPMAVLKDELQTRLMRREDKRLVLLMEKDSAISYSSLADIACAAHEADADMLQLLTITR